MATMTEAGTIFERFKEELGSFLLKLQTVSILDVDAFERLNADSQKLGRSRSLRIGRLYPNMC